MKQIDKILELAGGLGTSTSDGRTVVDPGMLDLDEVKEYFRIAKLTVAHSAAARPREEDRSDRLKADSDESG